MVNEWLDAIANFTRLIPISHYGGGDYNRRTKATIEKTGYPWRHIIVTTLETFHSRFDHTFNKTGFWEQAGLFRRVILDEAHRLRTSGREVATNTSLPARFIVGYLGAPERTARSLLGLKPDFKWMLTATPLVNNLSDLRWIVRFLERDEWLQQNLPPGTFVDRDELYERRDQIRREPWDSEDLAPLPTALGTDLNAVWGPDAAPFEDGPNFESLVHCTTKAWSHGMAGPLDTIAKLTNRTLLQRGASAAEKQQLQEQQLLAGRRAFSILFSLMLRRGMASRIPFDNQQPIIDIPPMVMHTERIRFTYGKQLFRKLVDTPYPEMISQITGIPPAPAKPGKQQRATSNSFGPRWRFIRLVALSPLLAFAAAKGDIAKDLWIGSSPNGTEASKGNLLRFIKWFRSAFPHEDTACGGVNPIQAIPTKEKIADMEDRALVRALEYGAPKLAWLRRYLKKVVRQGKQRVVLWVFWPLSQWYIQEV